MRLDAIYYTVHTNQRNRVEYIDPDTHKVERFLTGDVFYPDPGTASQEFKAVYGRKAEYISPAAFSNKARNIAAAFAKEKQRLQEWNERTR